MASNQSHESYTDNIRVKISERYKPPPRINVAMTYAQRLTLNKQIQDSMPNYEFQLENAVLEKMKEWRGVRANMSEERKAKLEQIRQELRAKKLAIEPENLDEVEVKTVDETVNVPNTNIIYPNYSTNNGILMPMQIPNNYSSILTPIPLTNSMKEPCNFKPVDKSPFNVSDFENDTSSPFDNMELKSINDMEELAQVLKSEGTKCKESTVYQPYVQPNNVNTQHNYQNYGYTYNIPNSTSYVQPITTSDFSRTNGYYYTPDIVRQNKPYSYPKPSPVDYTHSTMQGVLVETKKSSCKSVPDIMNSLQAELDNSHIDNTSQYFRSHVLPQSSRPKSTEAIIYPSSKRDSLADPFSTLPRHQQDLCKTISSMGFPLSRVARACKLLGDDHKKIVEHLLALSELLDLGFSEKDVSNALMQCDNDKDKALDQLIS